ncbi:MAG: hypothetical protein QOE16_1432, partial [Microbacteriaceae bacterium]|nr:hypothetical protein [Microbacteriaceae bacterium]
DAEADVTDVAESDVADVAAGAVPAAAEPAAASAAAPAAAPAAKEAPTKKAAAKKPTQHVVFQPPVTEGEADTGEPGAVAGEQAAKMSPRAATKLLRRALELGHDKNDEEWLHTSAVKQQIKRMDPSFHEKSLGYDSFSDFVKSRSNFAEFDKASNGQKVRLRPPNAAS